MKKDEGHLIHEKIAIPVQSGRVPRPRLLRLLENNLDSYDATIINGRAGTGKTVLAEGFARRAGRAVSWYEVDGADSALRLFCDYLVARSQRRRFRIDSEGLSGLADRVERDRSG